MDKQLVEIPKYVADWIEKTKNELNLREAMSQGYAPHEVNRWLREMDQDGACLNQELFARAWLDGYEVEKEKRYIVKMKGMNKSSTILKLDKILDSWYLGEDAEYSYTKDAHTRKELEEAGFGGVFDSPLFEVEEVTE